MFQARVNSCSAAHRHEQKFVRTPVCKVTFKHLPQPLTSHIQSFGTHGQIFKIPPFSTQKSHSAGGRGGPRICCSCWNPNIFVTPTKISEPYDNPVWDKSKELRLKETNSIFFKFRDHPFITSSLFHYFHSLSYLTYPPFYNHHIVMFLARPTKSLLCRILAVPYKTKNCS